MPSFLDIVSTILSIFVNIIGLIPLILTVLWNFIVLVFYIKWTIFFFNNLLLFFIVLVVYPSIIVSFYGFGSDVLLQVHRNRR